MCQSPEVTSFLAKCRRFHVTLDVPPDVAAACHLQRHQSEAGPWGLAARKILCKHKKSKCLSV